MFSIFWGQKLQIHAWVIAKGKHLLNSQWFVEKGGYFWTLKISVFFEIGVFLRQKSAKRGVFFQHGEHWWVIQTSHVWRYRGQDRQPSVLRPSSWSILASDPTRDVHTKIYSLNRSCLGHRLLIYSIIPTLINKLFIILHIYYILTWIDHVLDIPRLIWCQDRQLSGLHPSSRQIYPGIRSQSGCPQQDLFP